LALHASQPLAETWSCITPTLSGTSHTQNSGANSATSGLLISRLLLPFFGSFDSGNVQIALGQKVVQQQGAFFHEQGGFGTSSSTEECSGHNARMPFGFKESMALLVASAPSA
jgi:hypothetical protein